MARVVVVLAACLEPALLAQTKGTSTAPASPPPAAPQQQQPSASAINQNHSAYIQPSRGSTSNDHLAGMELLPRPELLKSRIGQGTIYAPEIQVPREPRREYQNGMKALEKKDIKSAEQHLLRATELYPKYSSAFDALGLAYLQDPDKNDKKTGINTAAMNAFRQAVLLNPTNDSALTSLGGALLLENTYAEAESVLLRAAAIRAGSIRTLALLMYAQALQNHFNDVSITAKRVPEGREKEYPLIFYFRALAWEYKNDRVQAARDYRGFLKLDPSAQEAPLARASLQRLERK